MKEEDIIISYLNEGIRKPLYQSTFIKPWGRETNED